MGVVGKILQILAAALPALLDWWSRRKAEQSQAEAEARVADIRRDSAGEWLRKFNSQDNPDGNTTGAPGADKPGSAP